MHGKLFKKEYEEANKKLTLYGSFGGLLMKITI